MIDLQKNTMTSETMDPLKYQTISGFHNHKQKIIMQSYNDHINMQNRPCFSMLQLYSPIPWNHSNSVYTP